MKGCRPLSDEEVAGLKARMQKIAPTVYFRIFPEEREGAILPNSYEVPSCPLP